MVSYANSRVFSNKPDGEKRRCILFDEIFDDYNRFAFITRESTFTLMELKKMSDIMKSPDTALSICMRVYRCNANANQP